VPDPNALALCLLHRPLDARVVPGVAEAELFRIARKTQNVRESPRSLCEFSRDFLKRSLRLDLEANPPTLVDARKRALQKCGRRSPVESERTRYRGPGKRGKAARSRGAAEPERKPFRVHERQNATKLIVRVLEREREGCLPILTLESTQPARVVVDEPVRMIRDEAVPARIGFEIDFDDIRTRAARRCSNRRRQ
jgi:hypothetical protein